MSSQMAAATKERPASVRRRKMDFWDGMEHTFLMPSITAKEPVDMEHDLVFLCFPEKKAIWDAVASCVEKQLLLRKGVRIPSLGSFDTVRQRIQVGDRAVTIQSPTFHLAVSLAVGHNLTDDKAYLPGNKEVEPLAYAKVAAAASVSRLKAEACIQGTTSLLSHCLGKGENIALVLRDVGVLLIEDRRVKMKYFCTFLERMSGTKNLAIAGFKVPQLLDMVVSQVVPLASLTFSGRVIIFPEFVLEFVPKPPPKVSTLAKVPGEENQEKKDGFPALGQGTEVPVRFPQLSSHTYSTLMRNKARQLQAMEETEKRKKSHISVRGIHIYATPTTEGQISGLQDGVALAGVNRTSGSKTESSRESGHPGASTLTFWNFQLITQPYKVYKKKA
ncbi:coiled-coil domain-containing protein 81-like [Rissa tridactyla]|uniref:coiled-coil domain-containing protein 81-like n=1 Tax=Rissa tridactyla TaxID=75485 RepID=UPI0023BA91B8|nr:coiled-coil domain-containing protein 81-like [Rissa tridactyla]